MVIISFLDVILEVQNLLNNWLFQVFVWLVVFDILTGLAKGFFIKEGNSTKGLFGLVKHLLVIMLVTTAIPYLNLAGLNIISEWFLAFFAVVYVISLIENWGQLGLPLPNWVKQFFAKLRDQLDEGPGKNK